MSLQNTLTQALGSALLCLVGSASIAAPSIVVSVTPTGTTTDFAAVQSAIDAAAPGTVIVLENRNGSNSPTAFNFSAMTSNGIIVSTPFLSIRGEHEEGTPDVTTTIQGPGSFDAVDSMVTFTVETTARSLSIREIKFESFEAAVVLEDGAQGFTMKRCNVEQSANGIFGVGDNDGLWIEACRLSIVSTPLGGNAGITIQEGSDKIAILKNVIIGPGIGTATIANAGVIDFNLLTPAAKNLIAFNKVRKFDVGIYASSALLDIHGNVCRLCSDGIALVSKIDTAAIDGEQLVANASVTFNTSSNNTGDGIDLVSVEASILADNTLENNADNDIRCGSSSLGLGSSNIILKRNTGDNNCGSSALTIEGSKKIVKAIRP